MRAGFTSKVEVGFRIVGLICARISVRIPPPDTQDPLRKVGPVLTDSAPVTFLRRVKRCMTAGVSIAFRAECFKHFGLCLGCGDVRLQGLGCRLRPIQSWEGSGFMASPKTQVEFV